MKISHIKLHLVSAARRTGIVNYHVIVHLETTSGAIGWGEMSDLSHFPMYQFDIPLLEKTLNQLLVGRDPRNLAAMDAMFAELFPPENHKYGRSGLVRQGIELACLDLIGREDGVPVHSLLGGKVRDKIKVCYPIFRQRSEADIAPNLERIEAMLALGFDLYRVYVGANVDVDILFFQQMRERFGDTVKIKSIDFSNLMHWRQTLLAVDRIAEITDFMLIESPAYVDDLEGLAEFTRRSRYPVSEHVNSLSHAYTFVRQDCVDILNVSPYVMGGIRACLKVVALAEASHKSVLIGTTQELNLGTAAVAHLGATASVLDYPSDNTGPMLYVDHIVKQPLPYENGYLIVPDGVGLGVEPDETVLQSREKPFDWGFGSDFRGLIDRTPSK